MAWGGRSDGLEDLPRILASEDHPRAGDRRAPLAHHREEDGGSEDGER